LAIESVQADVGCRKISRASTLRRFLYNSAFMVFKLRNDTFYIKEIAQFRDIQNAKKNSMRS